MVVCMQEMHRVIHRQTHHGNQEDRLVRPDLPPNDWDQSQKAQGNARDVQKTQQRNAPIARGDQQDDEGDDERPDDPSHGSGDQLLLQCQESVRRSHLHSLRGGQLPPHALPVVVQLLPLIPCQRLTERPVKTDPRHSHLGLSLILPQDSRVVLPQLHFELTACAGEHGLSALHPIAVPRGLQQREHFLLGHRQALSKNTLRVLLGLLYEAIPTRLAQHILRYLEIDEASRHPTTQIGAVHRPRRRDTQRVLVDPCRCVHILAKLSEALKGRRLGSANGQSMLGCHHSRHPARDGVTGDAHSRPSNGDCALRHSPCAVRLPRYQRREGGAGHAGGLERPGQPRDRHVLLHRESSPRGEPMLRRRNGGYAGLNAVGVKSSLVVPADVLHLTIVRCATN
mmetsp:Transcript_40743/g.91822  ORF Transcript_40743/g.91822 Transcript_40743/m.91822 type:complete len:397 (-) Transcript_40743:2531-3721(-)